MLEVELVEVLGTAMIPAEVNARPHCGSDSGSRSGAGSGADAGRAAREELAAILRKSLTADPPLAAAWREAQATGEAAAVRRLASLLARRVEEQRQSQGRGELGEALRGWARRHAPRRDAAVGCAANTIGGSAQVHGPAIQARDVHGGVHVHHVLAAPEPAPPQPPVPRQLPPVPAYFVGRDEELAELNAVRAAHSASAPQVVVVSGQAGVGKTALVSQWLGTLVEQFPDGQLYADLRGDAAREALGPGEVLGRFLRALGAGDPPAKTVERVALWRSVTAGLRLAVMIDNAFTAAQVRQLLPAGPGSLVAVTSRQQLTGLAVDGASLYQLGVLGSNAALELLARGGGSRVAREAAAAREVVALCACLPLAVCLAAAQLAARPRRPVSAMARELARSHGPLDSLRVEGKAAIRIALDESYLLLSDAEARAYRLLGLLPTARYDRDVLAAAGGVSTAAAEEMLEALVEASLLEDLGPDRGYRFHDLVRLHARQRAQREESEEDRAAVLRRFVAWCVLSATAAEELLTPSHRGLPRDAGEVSPPVAPLAFANEAEAVAWLDAHRLSLMGAVRCAAEARWDAACWQLVDAMWPLFLRLRPARLWVEAHELGLAAARRAGDRAAVGRMLTSGGNGLRNAGRLDEAGAWYEEALRQAEEDGDLRQQAQALHNLGNVRLRSGRLAQAEGFFVDALRLREGIGYRRGAALSRLCLGEVALAREDFTRAGEHLDRAHAALMAEADAYDAARALALRGHAAARGGDPDGGARRLRDALTAFEAAGSRHWQGRTSEMLGQAAEAAGQLAKARCWYERGYELYRPVSPDDAQRLADRLRAL